MREPFLWSRIFDGKGVGNGWGNGCGRQAQRDVDIVDTRPGSSVCLKEVWERLIRGEGAWIRV